MDCNLTIPDFGDCQKHSFRIQTDRDIHLLEISINHPKDYKTLKMIFKKSQIESLEGLGEGWVYDEDGKAIESLDQRKPIFKCTYFYHEVLDYSIIHDDHRNRPKPTKFFYLYGKRLTKEEVEFMFIFYYKTQLAKENYEACKKLREQAKTRFPNIDFDKIHNE